MATRGAPEDDLPAAVARALNALRSWHTPVRPAQAHRPCRTSRLPGLEHPALQQLMSGRMARATDTQRRDITENPGDCLPWTYRSTIAVAGTRCPVLSCRNPTLGDSPARDAFPVVPADRHLPILMG